MEQSVILNAMEENDTRLLTVEDKITEDVINGIAFTTSIVGIFLNIATIMAVSHLPWSAKPNLKLVQSVCVANLLFLLNYFFYMITYYSNPSQSGYAATCLMFEILRCVIYLFIYLNMTYIVLDLYLAVTNPLGYASIITTSRTNKMLVLTVFICLIVMALAVTFNYITLDSTTEIHTHESSCSIYPSYQYIRSLHWIYKVSIFTCIPVFIVLLVIIVLAVQATCSTTNINNGSSNTRGVVNVYLVVLAFLLCFGPYQFVSFYIQYYPHMYFHYVTICRVFEHLFYLSAFLTPLIYSLRMNSVKKGYTLMFKKCISAASDYQSVLYGE